MASDGCGRGPRMYARVMVDASYDLEQKPGGALDNVRLSKGESLEVLEFHSDDWWKVRRCHDGKIMFAPPAYLELDYSRQDSLERRASSLESPKSSQEEADHSKDSKDDTLDDLVDLDPTAANTPPEPLERDYPTATQPHQPAQQNQQQQQQHQQLLQQQQYQSQQQVIHSSQPQPPPRSALRHLQTQQYQQDAQPHIQQQQQQQYHQQQHQQMHRHHHHNAPHQQLSMGALDNAHRSPTPSGGLTDRHYASNSSSNSNGRSSRADGVGGVGGSAGSNSSNRGGAGVSGNTANTSSSSNGNGGSCSNSSSSSSSAAISQADALQLALAVSDRRTGTDERGGGSSAGSEAAAGVNAVSASPQPPPRLKKAAASGLLAGTQALQPQLQQQQLHTSQQQQQLARHVQQQHHQQQPQHQYQQQHNQSQQQHQHQRQPQYKRHTATTSGHGVSCQSHHQQQQQPATTKAVAALAPSSSLVVSASSSSSSSSSCSTPGPPGAATVGVPPADPVTRAARVRHSQSSPPNSIFAHVGLEVYPANDNDAGADSSPSPGGKVIGERVFERRLRTSLDEALRERREKIAEAEHTDDQSDSRSDEDSLIDHQQTNSDLDTDGDTEKVAWTSSLVSSPASHHFGASALTGGAPAVRPPRAPARSPVSVGPVGGGGGGGQLRPRSDSQPIYANAAAAAAAAAAEVLALGGQLSAPLDLALATTTPPFPSPHEDPVRYLADHWGEYRSSGGRPYYYNYVTGEHSWKPPRARRRQPTLAHLSSTVAGGGGGQRERQRLTQSVDSVDALFLTTGAADNGGVTDAGTAVADSSVEEGMMPSPPPSPAETTASGWSKVYDDISGSMYFTNDMNDERWCSSQDSDGRVYFYQEGTQRTAWELPHLPPSNTSSLSQQQRSSVQKLAQEFQHPKKKVAPRPPLRRKRATHETATTVTATTATTAAVADSSSGFSRRSGSEADSLGGAAVAPLLRTKTLPANACQSAATANGGDDGGALRGSPAGAGGVVSSQSNSNMAAAGGIADASQFKPVNAAPHQPLSTQQRQPSGEGVLQNSLRSLKTRSMVLPDLDWRSKSVDIIHGLQQQQQQIGQTAATAAGTPVGDQQQTLRGVHVLSVQKLPHLSDIQEAVKRQGTLNKADLVKAGKKVQKKNWACCFLVLTSKNLFIYKDAQSGQQPTLGEGALNRLPLPGALIEWCPDKSKRKNCFQLSTVQGQNVLFQDDNVQTSKEWFESIKGCIIHLPLGYDISGEILKARTPQSRDSAGAGNTAGALPNTVARDFSVGTLTKDTLKRSKKVLRSKSIKLLRPSNTLPGVSNAGGNGGAGLVAISPAGPSPLESATGSEKGSTTDLVTLSPNERKRRIGDRLKMFFMRRPTLEMLKEKGIIKDEPVFGCSLAVICARERSTVPRFVVRCIDAIENKDMRADGIYRASGNLSQVQRLRYCINTDDYAALDREEDVHVLTGALKMFFREMREPLLTFALFDRLLAATQIRERQSKLRAFEAILHELPQVNRDTLRFLLEHLLRVKEYSSENRMHVQNLAIVFGPTLLSPADRVSRNIAMDTIQQNQVIEFILVEFDALFR